MNVHGEEEEQTAFEICVVVPRRNVKEEEDETCDCVEFLVEELRNVGFIVEEVLGLTDEFIKVSFISLTGVRYDGKFEHGDSLRTANEFPMPFMNLAIACSSNVPYLCCLLNEELAAPLETLGRAAAQLQMKKPTYIGMDLQFEWEEVEAFVRQPDGSLFSWFERFQCYQHLLHGIVNKSKVDLILTLDGKGLLWQVGESLMKMLESEGIVKQVFLLHDEIKRKKLLKSWVLNWRNFTNQPIDDMYSYFGLKIAIYFAFLRMYTRWTIFPAAFGLVVHLVDFG
ncbi:unnamed protein product [Dovyalis caffra]|uniref:Anoctamin transmembrane domain-containing protein n=1 Tax=Dovyalis caffra TaxID=77055 RepID=A0AAV1SS04_9ROSI|nr:unnamed protein product [Dovyalis caffra]